MGEENIRVEEEKEVKKVKSGLATAAMVLGIVGICTSFIPVVNNASFVLGVLSLIFGAIALVKKMPVGKAVSGLVLGILAIVITLVMQAAMVDAIDGALDDLDNELSYMDGEKTEEILRDNLDVTIGNFEVIEEEYYEETKLSVTLKNKGSEKKSFSVTIEAVDAQGNRIESDDVYVSDLGAGQSQVFDAFTLVTSDKIDKLKGATFRVLEVSMY